MKRLLSLFFFSFVALAEHDVPNGGHLVKCVENDKANYELLDFFEARRSQGATFPNISNQNDMQDFLSKRARIHPFFKYVIQKMRHNAFVLMSRSLLEVPFDDSTLANSFDFLEDGKITEVEDHNILGLPSNCHLEQVALHREYSLPGVPRFLIHKERFNKLSLFSQAGLHAHEEIYFFMSLIFGHTSSVKSRYLNSLMFSQEKLEQKILRNRFEAVGLYPRFNDDIMIPPHKEFSRIYRWSNKGKSFELENQVACVLKHYKETKKIIHLNNDKIKIETHIQSYESPSLRQNRNCYREEGFVVTENKSIQDIRESHYQLIDSVYDNIGYFSSEKLKVSFSQDELILFPFERLSSSMLVILNPY